MNVTVGSMFRDSAGYLDLAFAQYEDLHRLLTLRGDTCRFVFVENDSTDNTYNQLAGWEFPASVIRVSDDCPYYPSVDRPDRWTHLAWVANHALDNIPDDADVFLWVESDLTWHAEDLLHLIDATEEWPVVAAANMKSDGRFFDTHGTRVDGVRFLSEPPYHPEFDGLPMAVDSAGGCLALRAAIARNTRNQPDTGYRGWCEDIRRLGFPIILDPTIRVVHQ